MDIKKINCIDCLHGRREINSMNDKNYMVCNINSNTEHIHYGCKAFKKIRKRKVCGDCNNFVSQTNEYGITREYGICDFYKKLNRSFYNINVHKLNFESGIGCQYFNVRFERHPLYAKERLANDERRESFDNKIEE